MMGGENISFKMKERKMAVKELANVLANSKYFDTTFGNKTRSRRAELSHSDMPSFPHVIIEPSAALCNFDHTVQNEWLKILELAKKAKLDPYYIDPGRMDILPALDPEPDDIQIVKDLVAEIENALKALETRPHSPELLDGEEGLTSTGKNTLDDEEQQCPPQGAGKS